jgi:hypothetical protein
MIKRIKKYILYLILFIIIFYIFNYIYNIKEPFEDSLIEKINNTYFQIVTPQLLKPYNSIEVSELFSIDYIVNEQTQVNCISASLFCQNVDNTYVDEHERPSREPDSKWYNKYFKQLLQLIEEFNNSSYSKNWKIRIYLEASLINMISLIKNNNVEIYIMKHNSVGAQPGMLWRYLSFDDKSLNSILATDIDQKFEEIRKDLDNIEKCESAYPKSVLIRKMPYYMNAFNNTAFKINNTSDAVNVTVVLGSMVGFYPKRSSINIKELMIKYKCLRMDRYNSKYPHLDYDSDAENTIFNKPIKNNLGWGGHWYTYGFDEKFLKAVVFPYFAQRGEVVSILNTPDEIAKVKKLENTTLLSYFKDENKFYEYYNNIYH